MRVSVDADLCSGCGQCVATCPSVFTHRDEHGADVGICHVLDGGAVTPSGEVVEVPARHESAVLSAALDCPGEIIAVFSDAPLGRPAAT